MFKIIIKKLNIIIFILMLMINTYSITINNNVFADSVEYYAQIQKSSVYMYKENLETPLFEIPETYYVKLIENSKNDFYTAEYMGIIGYIKENDIQCVSNIPNIPYLQNVSFRNYGSQSSELRSEPSRIGGTSTLICELPLYETNFEYIGKISGEEIVPNRGDVWYYCKYTKNNQTKIGYIYSGLIDMFTNYYSNPIDSYPILKHNWKVESSEISKANISLPSNKQSLIIFGISIPLLILIIALFRPVNKKENNINKNKKIDLATFVEPRYTTYNMQNTKVFKLNNTKNNYNKKTKKHNKNKDYYEL